MREATHFSVEPYDTTLIWGLLAKLLACATRGNTPGHFSIKLGVNGALDGERRFCILLVWP